MQVSRIEVNGVGEFAPRDWIRKEVLWASLMTPYGQQLGTWYDDIRQDLHNGNQSRKDLYDIPGNPEAQALSFFNHGKTVAGHVSGVALFAACKLSETSGIYNPLAVQSEAIDKILASLDKREHLPLNREFEDGVFVRAALLAKRARGCRPGSFGHNHALSLASSLMSKLAVDQADDWIQNSLQNEYGSLPMLQVPDGGTPRSGGRRVEMLQPIFHKIIESEQFLSL